MVNMCAGAASGGQKEKGFSFRLRRQRHQLDKKRKQNRKRAELCQFCVGLVSYHGPAAGCDFILFIKK